MRKIRDMELDASLKYGEERIGTGRTSHLLDKQFDVTSRYESKGGDGERDGWWIRTKWDHPQRVGLCRLLGHVISEIASRYHRVF